MVPTTGRDLSRIRGGMAAVIAVRRLGIRRRAALADRLGARPGAEPSRCRDDWRRGRPHGPPGRWPLLREAGPFSYSVDAGTGGLRAGFRSGQIFGGKDPLWLETFRPQDTLFFFAFTSGVAGLAGNFFNTSVGGGGRRRVRNHPHHRQRCRRQRLADAGRHELVQHPGGRLEQRQPGLGQRRVAALRPGPVHLGGPARNGPGVLRHKTVLRTVLCQTHALHRPGPGRTGRSSAQNGPQDRFVSSEPQAG
jgi:hypothetical protein